MHDAVCKKMTAHKITSEVFAEKDDAETQKEGNSAVSKFFFKYPPHMRKNRTAGKEALEYDEDGDLILDRIEEGAILIEHSVATELKLVGLQIWRGALLLGDYILSHPEVFQNKTVLELGSGVGFDSIIAGTLAKEVVCTDVNLGGILRLIEKNFQRNKALVKSKVCVTELDFLSENWNATLSGKVKNVDVIMAADVIYDDKITDGFVKTLAKLLDTAGARQAYVALEKRYVFTIADLDSVAPMYEEFLRCLRRHKVNWSIEEIKLDFPQYFRYQRLSQLTLMRIEKKI
ncbi:methyltransferase-like protein 22 isoform X1 [Nasonia vitripennis]|uniref:Methyltransferase-like protein 22 n=2 Tax=Nasonia vitripennis TaxID=7425 RepID=A0A7M7PVK1_NASVI|nr:methyltransferase-like protein 22 isoform X1 [Nasonia vitripennis]XP_032451887.1 methyltransferase-like protein 22 isoform X1 [Nasonia vitripennis]